MLVKLEGFYGPVFVNPDHVTCVEVTMKYGRQCIRVLLTNGEVIVNNSDGKYEKLLKIVNILDKSRKVPEDIGDY